MREFRWFLGITILLFVALVAVARVSAQAIDRGKSQVRRAQDYERRRNFESALRIYRDLFDEVPQNFLYYEGLKRNMLRLGKLDELSRVIAILIGRQQQSHRYKADLGLVYYKQTRKEEAFEIWYSLTEEFPQNRSVTVYVANAMIQNRLYDEAIEVYLSARESLKQKSVFVFELANIYVMRLKYQEATEEYLRYLADNPKQFAYVEDRIASYTKEEDNARQVIGVLQTHLSYSGESYFVRKLLANIYLRAGEFGRALQEFKLLENQRSLERQGKKDSGKEIFFFAEKSLRAGQYEYATEAFAMIIDNYQKSPYRSRALFGSAQVQRKQGYPAEAMDKLDLLIEREGNSGLAQEARFEIAEISFEDLFEIDKALLSYYDLVDRYPRSKNATQALFRIGDCYMAKGALDEAITWYNQIISQPNLTSDLLDQARYKSAYANFLNQDYDKAKELLNQILEGLASQGVANRYMNDALELTFLLEENVDRSLEALKSYSQAQGLRYQRQEFDAIEVLRSVLEDYPTANIVEESILQLGDLENGRGDYRKAMAYYRSMLENYPESVHNGLAQKRIAEIYESGLGDSQKAFEAYEHLLINYPNSIYLEEVRQRMRRLQPQQLSN